MTDEHSHQKGKATQATGISSGLYGLAFLGAVIYYFRHATNFWEGVLGFLKALVWPAVLIYRLFEFLKM